MPPQPDGWGEYEDDDQPFGYLPDQAILRVCVAMIAELLIIIFKENWSIPFFFQGAMK